MLVVGKRKNSFGAPAPDFLDRVLFFLFIIAWVLFLCPLHRHKDSELGNTWEKSWYYLDGSMLESLKLLEILKAGIKVA